MPLSLTLTLTSLLPPCPSSPSRSSARPDPSPDDSNPTQVISIKCSTNEFAQATYEPLNKALYARLHYAHVKGLAPAIEPLFPQFETESVPCSGHEKTMGNATVA